MKIPLQQKIQYTSLNKQTKYTQFFKFDSVESTLKNKRREKQKITSSKYLCLDVISYLLGY